MIITINDFGGGSGSGKYEVVTELPSSGKTGTIYLAPSENPQEKNVYNEYVYVNGDWEQFGEKIDLSNYYDKTEVDNLLNNKADNTRVEDIENTVGGFDSRINELESNKADSYRVDDLESRVSTVEQQITLTAILEDGSVIDYTLYGYERWI